MVNARQIRRQMTATECVHCALVGGVDLVISALGLLQARRDECERHHAKENQKRRNLGHDAQLGPGHRLLWPVLRGNCPIPPSRVCRPRHFLGRMPLRKQARSARLHEETADFCVISESSSFSNLGRPSKPSFGTSQPAWGSLQGGVLSVGLEGEGCAVS